MHKLPIMDNCPAKFEKNRRTHTCPRSGSRHVKMPNITTKIATNQPSLIQSLNHCTSYVSDKVLGMCKVWRELVEGRTRYRSGRTYTQTDGQMDDNYIACTNRCYDVLFIQNVWSELFQACSRYSSRHTFSQSKWPPVGHLWSDQEINAHAYV